ncbi:MAG TPA: ABC transporter ATP-binding protein [Steroidobacteraceae bacterium]|nr:ABC transporter ATP-binding protein [Steroidobacteraceae bacterium]
MSTLVALWRLLRPAQRRRLMLLQGVSLAMALSTVVGMAAIMPFFAVLADPALLERSSALAWIQQAAGIREPREFLIALGCGFIVLLVLSNAINLAGTLAMSRFAYQAGDSFRIALFDEYLRRDYLFHARTGSARLASHVLYESDRVTGLLQSAFVLLTNLVTIVLIVASIAFVNLLVSSLMLLFFVACYALIYGVARHRLLDNGLAQTQAGAERVAVVEQGFGAIKDLLVSHRQSAFTRRFAEACSAISSVAANTQLIGQFPRHLLETVAGVGLVAAALLMSARSGGLGPWLAELTFIGFASYRLLPGVQQSYFAIVTIRAHRFAFDHIADDLAAALAVDTRHERAADQAWRGRPALALELLDVSFRYSKAEKPAAERVSLHVPAGAAIGFIGANGSGKTTVADLILGLLRPESGRIEVDGVALDEHNLPGWQATLGYVPQQVFLLDATVRENIAFGIRPEAVDDTRLRDAARLSGAQEFIDGLAQGFDERLGEHGARLSGGQRQLIGIARALYRDPSLLVLDEATSSLDPDAEQAVVAAVLRLRGTRTIIVIAHRPATVCACDRIHEFADGRIVASGSVEELRRKSVAFRTLAGVA